MWILGGFEIGTLLHDRGTVQATADVPRVGQDLVSSTFNLKIDNKKSFSSWAVFGLGIGADSFGIELTYRHNLRKILDPTRSNANLDYLQNTFGLTMDNYLLHSIELHLLIGNFLSDQD